MNLSVRAWRAIFGLTLAAVLVLALKPNEPKPPHPLPIDKVEHLLAFAVLYGLGRRGRWSNGALVVGLVGVGIGIELLQGLSPNRESSLGDVAADVVGMALGAWVARRWPGPGSSSDAQASQA